MLIRDSWDSCLWGQHDHYIKLIETVCHQKNGEHRECPRRVPWYGYLYPTNLSTTLHRTMVTQHQSQCQQHGPLSEPALTVTSINIEGMSAAKQQLLAKLYEKQKCDVLCVQETHRGLKAIRPNIRGMSLVAEIPHEQYGSAIFVRNNCICNSTSTSNTNNVEIIQAQLNKLTVTSVYKYFKPFCIVFTQSN